VGVTKAAKGRVRDIPQLRRPEAGSLDRSSSIA